MLYIYELGDTGILGLPSRMGIEDLSDVFTYGPTNKAGNGETRRLQYSRLSLVWVSMTHDTFYI